MKKTAAILMLAILAFNWIGYRFVSHWLESSADHTFQAKIEKEDYDEESLIRITVPLNAPYLFSGDNTEYERYDGQIDIDGVNYRYVKRKISHGDLVLLCLPNENRKRIQNSRMDFFKLVNDLNHSSQSKEKSASSYKSFTTEYSQEINSWNIVALNTAPQQNNSVYISYLNTGFDQIQKQPPRA